MEELSESDEIDLHIEMDKIDGFSEDHRAQVCSVAGEKGYNAALEEFDRLVQKHYAGYSQLTRISATFASLLIFIAALVWLFMFSWEVGVAILAIQASTFIYLVFK